MEKITYKKSFASKLVLEQVAIPYYQDIKDLCATRKKVSTRLSFNKETINVGRNKVAVMKISRKNITLYLCFFIFFNVSNKLSLSIIFTLKIAPIVDLTTFGLYASAVSFDTITCFKPTLSIVLRIVPKFPGSCTSSKATIMSWE